VTRIRTRPRSATILAVAALVAAATGCGGGGEESSPPRPTIAAEVADDLAARSEAVADAIDAADICLAAVRADELQQATIEAIQSGRIPRAFQEDLEATANSLVNEVNCPPPPPAPPPQTTTDEDDSDDDNARSKKKKDKKKPKPPPPEPAPTTEPPEEEDG
jgi:outer membrane biosynthesis protein TonB